MGKFANFYKEWFLETHQPILEMPQSYSGDVVYQKDSKFIPISKNNIKSYTVLGQNSEYIFLLHPSGEKGYVFSTSDMDSSQNHVVPVMTVSLRDTDIKGYKQAHNLRIRQSGSRQNLTSAWYFLYVQKMGGIVSDREHLAGGKYLWRSLINSAHDFGLNAFIVRNGEVFPVSRETPDENIWTSTEEGRNTLIFLEKPASGK